MDARDFLRRLWVLMLTVFVDMIGFLIVLPLLPFYAERSGADPFRVGALISSFALAQLTMAPLWGRLSDRYGRRPMILAGLLISAVAYVLFEAADSLWMLLLSRLVQGAGAGTVGVVVAYLSDSVPREDRAKALGWLTAATSAGVMVGPALGSLAASLGTVGPGYLAAGLCVTNLLFGLRWLPESGGPRRQPREAPPRGATRRAILEILRHPRGAVGAVVWIYALGMMAFMAMNGVLALFLERRFGVTEATIGWFYVFVGGVSLVMRTLVLGPAVRRFGEVRTLRLGALSMALGLAVVPLARNFWELGLAVLLIPVGTALLFPATTSMVSHRAVGNQTGLMLGVQQFFGGFSRMLGPLWAGAAFQHLDIGAPFWLAAALMVGVRFFAQTVAEDGRPQEAPPDLEAVVSSEPS
ncbi:MAG: MFS transporter [Thermoanaerobaculia bacterium]